MAKLYDSQLNDKLITCVTVSIKKGIDKFLLNDIFLSLKWYISTLLDRKMLSLYNVGSQRLTLIHH